MRAPLSIGCLLAGACFVNFEPRQSTYLVDSLSIPEDDEDPAAGVDFDFDGDIDNQLPAWRNAFLFVVDLQAQLDLRVASGEFLFGLDLIKEPRNDSTLSVFTAETLTEDPLFTGADNIFATGEESFFPQLELFERQDLVEAKGAQINWLLFPFEVGEPLKVPLRRAQLSARATDAGCAGRLVGTIDAFEAAPVMERAPEIFAGVIQQDAINHSGGSPIPCEATDAASALVCQIGEDPGFCSDRLQDGVVTGVCVSADSFSSLLLSSSDDNKDGQFIVDYDEATGRFIRNELSIVFSISEEGSPIGILGAQFVLDLDNNGIDESMPIGLLFTAVPAARVD